MKNAQTFTKIQLTLFYLPSILSTCIIILIFIDCNKRIQNGGIHPPGELIIILCLIVSVTFLFCSIHIWRKKNLTYRQLALALLSLVPESWIWLAYFKDGRIYPLYLNIFTWMILCSLIPLSLSGRIRINTWLTVFFFKGFFLFISAYGFLRAPWLINQIDMAGRVMLAPFQFIGPVYQLLALGFIWRWKEKKELER